MKEINHTAENISNTLKDIFAEWEISSKVLCIVTDNASNMLKACELLEKRHLPCYSNSLIWKFRTVLYFKTFKENKKSKRNCDFFQKWPCSYEDIQTRAKH